MEIMTALLILAFAFLPIIGVIGTSTKDTDVANSTVFAQTTARNILDTLLDDVPFNCISAGTDNIAKLEDYTDANYSIESFKQMIGTGSDEAKGQLIDERGVVYNISIYVWPIFASKTDEEKQSNVENELLFTYLPRPQYEDKAEDWYTYEKEKEYAFLKVSAAGTPLSDPYSGYNEIEKKIKSAYELGARPNQTTKEYCVMKKILFKMEWQSRGRVASSSLELYTMKANLDSDGKSIGS